MVLGSDFGLNPDFCGARRGQTDKRGDASSMEGDGSGDQEGEEEEEHRRCHLSGYRSSSTDEVVQSTGNPLRLASCVATPLALL